MVGHGAPGVILRRGFRVPDVAGVTGELSAFERATVASRSQILPRAVFTREAARLSFNSSASLKRSSVRDGAGR